MDGQVIGINSAIMSGGRGGFGGGGGGNDGVGFAIPIDLASNVADKLIKDGKVNRARIGVAIRDLSPAETEDPWHRPQNQRCVGSAGGSRQPCRQGLV